LTLYLCHERAVLYRRNRESWASIVARLDPQSTSELKNDPSQHINASEGAEVHPQRVRDLQALHRKAAVMLELADYAERNGDTSLTATVEALRYDAAQIRIGVVKTLVMRSFPRWAH